jgi:hypothetical protein
MANNYTTNAGAGGNTYASDDVGGVHYPYVKTAFGADDTATVTSATNPFPTHLTPNASNGITPWRSTVDLDESEEEVKASAGTVYGIIFTNTATSTRWLKFYNDTAANVIVGTTTPLVTIGLPGNASDDVTGVLSFPGGIKFTTAISVACTTGVADNDTGAPTANDVPFLTVLYA